jgi:O-antigen ligase
LATEGRVAWPSLCIFAAALSLLAVALYPERWYHWTGTALLALACAPWRSYPVNALGAIVGLYCAWLLGNALFVTEAYASEGLYHPLLLLGGFTAAATLGPRHLAALFRFGVALAATLVVLGFAQYLGGLWLVSDLTQRASATFATPNTLGSALNFFLAPLALLYLLDGSRRLLVLALWLFAGLVATESRGAMLALGAGLAFGALTLLASGRHVPWRRVANFAAGCAGAWVAIVAATPFLRAGEGARGELPSAATWLGRATWDRSDIYAATMRLIMEHPFAGAGANMFFPLFERVKPESLTGFDYRYAHCDYLQVWLEFGLPGLLLLLAVVIASLLLALRLARRAPADPVPVVCGAALATCFAHAMVDFPLYIPFILMLTGAFLGVLARRATPAAEARGPLGERLTPVMRGALAVAALAWLAQPAVADFAVSRSIASLREGDVKRALYWQSVAQRLEPRLANHYWAEGMIWRDQLEETRNPLFAAEADSAFLRGMRANPHEVVNLFNRVQLHRRFPELLKEPASPAEIVAWAQQAVAMRPLNGGVQAEYARVLAYAGREDEARALARVLAERHPDSESVRRLQREL